MQLEQQFLTVVTAREWRVLNALRRRAVCREGRPSPERCQKLFAHLRAHVANPQLHPDLRVHERGAGEGARIEDGKN